MSDSILYVAATPIGNLGDMTKRALEVLGDCDQVIAEDTRVTKKLLNHYGIDVPCLRYPPGEGDIEGFVASTLAEKTTVLTSDAGTPGVSDPGSAVVRYARAQGITVIPLPGPSALAAAMSVCGFQTNPAVFLGFLPPKGEKRRTELSRFLDFVGIVVLYESVHKIPKLIDDLEAVFGENIEFFIGREMTKVHEEYRHFFSIHEFRTAQMTIKGEFVVILNLTRQARKGKK